MNENKYKKNANSKDTYTRVVQALQKGYEQYPHTWTRLYLTKTNGLGSTSYQEAKDIIDSLANDGLVQKNHYAKESEILQNRKPTPAPPAYAMEDNWPYHIFPFNYFSVGIEEKFHKLTSSIGSPLFLMSLIPKGKKYKYLKRIATVLVENTEVNNYKLALCFNSRLKEKDFLKNKITNKKYTGYIKNRIKTLREILKDNGYTVKYDASVTRLVKIQP